MQKPQTQKQKNWYGWSDILADKSCYIQDDPLTAMNITSSSGFGTVSASLMALSNDINERPIWLFCDGPPDQNKFAPIDI